MDSLHKDPFFTILSFLDFRSFVAMLLVCSRCRSRCAEYVAALDPRDRGYRLRAKRDGGTHAAQLIKEFTCFCGLTGWNIRKECACWRKCYTCHRSIPRRLSHQSNKFYCEYGCINALECGRCMRTVNQMNRTAFRVWELRSRWCSGVELVCVTCLHNGKNYQTDLYICSISPVSKGFVAWLMITDSYEDTLYDTLGNFRMYTKIRDKEYIEVVRKVLGSEDPDNPLLALLEAFT